jgi:Leucine-rich repeat (LRR) protein
MLQAVFLLAVSAASIERMGGKAELDAAGNVVAVNLRGSWVNDAEMIELARLPHLRRLDLSHTRISDEGLLNLKEARGITDLNLYYSEWITDQGLTAIRNWKQLKRLNLRGTRISDGTLALVSKLPAIEALDIANTQVTDNGLDHLITLTNLKELSLGRSRLSENALEVLRMLPTLTYLDLSGARPVPPDMARRRGGVGALSDSTLRALAELKDLRTLKLGYSDITSAGLAALAGLDKIEKLGLESCAGVDDSAVAELAKRKALKYLDVQETRFTPDGLAALRTARPDVVILANPKPPKTD